MFEVEIDNIKIKTTGSLPGELEGQRFSPDGLGIINNNIIMRAVRDGMMCSPPLTISKQEIDFCIEKFKISLDLTLNDVKKLNY